MGRKKRRTLDLKPFCYYCDRAFEDEKVLLLHQKARHFKCHRCNRKLDTATGLVVHLLQVHKETTTKVPNAVAGRENPELVVHGMSGVPSELVAEKQQKLAAEIGSKKSTKHEHTVFGSGLFDNQGGFANLFGVAHAFPNNVMPDISTLAQLLGIVTPAPAPAPVAAIAPPPIMPPAVPILNQSVAVAPSPMPLPAAPIVEKQPPPPPQTTAKVTASHPPGGLLVFDDDLMSPEELRAYSIQKYRPLLCVK